MQKFTKTEIEWIIGELDRTAANLKQQAANKESAGLAAGFMNLRSEQFAKLADKLKKTILEGSKQIKIIY